MAARRERGPAGHRKKAVGVTPRTFANRLKRQGGGVALACFQGADVGTVHARSLRKRGLS